MNFRSEKTWSEWWHQLPNTFLFGSYKIRNIHFEGSFLRRTQACILQYGKPWIGDWNSTIAGKHRDSKKDYCILNGKRLMLICSIYITNILIAACSLSISACFDCNINFASCIVSSASTTQMGNVVSSQYTGLLHVILL